jgi:subtilisin family serine protease
MSTKPRRSIPAGRLGASVVRFEGRLRSERRLQAAAVASVLAISAVVGGVVHARGPSVLDLGMYQPDEAEVRDGLNHYVVHFEDAPPAGVPSDDPPSDVAPDPEVAPELAPDPEVAPDSEVAPDPDVAEDAASPVLHAQPVAYVRSASVTAPDADGQADGTIAVPVDTVDGKITADTLAQLAAKGQVLRIEQTASGYVAIIQPDDGADAAPTPAVPTTAAPPIEPPTPTTGNVDPDTPVAPLSEDERVAALQAVPGTTSVRPVGPGSYSVRTSATADAYEAVTGVTGVTDDAIAFVTTNDPYWSTQWAMQNTGQSVGAAPDGGTGTAGADIKPTTAWETTSGAGVVVAVIDTGVDTNHPDLAGALWKNTKETCANNVDDDHNGFVDDCDGWDFANNDKTVNDSGTIGGVTVDNSHGTHVSGTIAARRDNGVGVAGVAPAAKIMPLKVSNAGAMWMSDVARAFNYAVANGASVVNMSLSSGFNTARATVSDMEAALATGRTKGVIAVVAAGNDTVNIDDGTHWKWPASFPADNMITVAASTNHDTSASFSNWGPVSVDLYAPGSYIASTAPGGGYQYMSGTSMASPHVAGAVALLRAAAPTEDFLVTRARLLASPVAPPALAGKTVTGRRLDIGSVMPAGGEGASFDVSGLGGAAPGPLSAVVRPRLAPGSVSGSESVHFRASLLTAIGSKVYGVTAQPVHTDAGDTATGDDASVELGTGAGYVPTAVPAALKLGVTLPAGNYALVLDAYRGSDGSAVGRPSVSYFAVAVPSTTTTKPPTTKPPTTKPAGSAPTTRSGTTTTRPGGAAPTTRAGTNTTKPTGAVTTKPATTTTKAATPAPTTKPPTTKAPTTKAPTTKPAGVTPTTRAATSTTKPAGSGPTTRPETATTRLPATTKPPATQPPATAPPLAPPAPPVANGPLHVDTYTPRYGSTAGGTRITIKGAGFGATTYVAFGGSPASVTVTDPSTLLVTAPSHLAGLVDVQVSTGALSVTSLKAFEYRTPGPNGEVPVPGAPLPTTRPAATTTTRGGAATTTTPPTTRDPAAPPALFDFGATSSASGLTLRALASGIDLAAPASWSSLACRASSCPAVKV